MEEADFFGMTLHPRALEGLRHFNAGEYFEAHEELEAAWRAEPGRLRDLYQGILQVGVAIYHLERKNYAGALKVLRRGQAKLAPFPDQVLGVDVRQVREDANTLEEYLSAGDWSRLPPRVKRILVH